VTWTNTSSIPLAISSVAVSGDYAVASTTCSGSIAANVSCVVNVSFTPTLTGTRAGTLTVTSSSSANPTLTAALSGRGVADVEASSTVLSFGNVDIGSSGNPQVITLTNHTAASITLTSIVVTGDYSDATTCGATLAGLSTCSITVGFTPTATGTRSGTLTVNTNDTKYPIITVILTGNGVDFSINVAPTSGHLVAGYGTTITASLSPIGGFSGSIALTCTTDAGGSTCKPNPSLLTLSSSVNVPVAIATTSQYTVIGYEGGLGQSGHPWRTGLCLLSASWIVFALTMFGRRGRLPWLVILAGLLSLLGFTGLGCSGKLPARNESPTYPGNYTYTITATDGTLTRSATYSLNVTER
jgi:hypothetical protein